MMYRPSFTPSLKRLYDRIPKFKVAAIGAPLLILAFAIHSFAPNDSSSPTSPSKSFATITIKNFGQMDNHFYRGAQPKEEEYKKLAELGVKTIIDLRDDPIDLPLAALLNVETYSCSCPKLNCGGMPIGALWLEGGPQ